LSSKKAIDDWALDYWLLQQYAKLCYRFCYRKVELADLRKIPVNEPVILAPNHQNALMDAMVIVCNTQFQSVFLARADIFKGKRMVNFLTFINIMPVYRIRDGIENVKKNDEVFAKTTQVLHNRQNPLIMFAEGNHGDRRRLRPLVKGMFRIAFQAQEAFGGEDAVKIVPIGIDYGHYQNFRTTLLANVGAPIELSAFYNEYEENPVAAINHLKDVYAEAQSKLMIDIQTEEYYELYQGLRVIFNDEMKLKLGLSGNSLKDAFLADKAMISALDGELEAQPDRISTLNKAVTEYLHEVKKVRLRDWVLNPLRNTTGIHGLFMGLIGKILLFPVFVFGYIHNYMPYRFTASKIKNIKDAQFHSSFKFVVGMIVFPVWYLVIAGILTLFSMPGWIAVIYLLLLPFTGIAAFEYARYFKKWVAKIRVRFSANPAQISTLQSKRKEIIRMMLEIINKQHTDYEIQR
jgi:1-acyl-sn-glycerol-3-phosphate acyltransferase